MQPPRDPSWRLGSVVAGFGRTAEQPAPSTVDYRPSTTCFLPVCPSARRRWGTIRRPRVCFCPSALLLCCSAASMDPSPVPPASASAREVRRSSTFTGLPLPLPSPRRAPKPPVKTACWMVLVWRLCQLSAVSARHPCTPCKRFLPSMTAASGIAPSFTISVIPSQSHWPRRLLNGATC